MISVLYVDDEDTLLDVCKIFLEMNGEFAVTTETSAARALNLLKTKDYNAVISDYQMPGMDGIEFLRQLRKEHPTLPFIIFTGKGREEIVIAAFESGADFYLQKGGDPDSQFAELAHKIRRSVEQRNAEQTLMKNENRFRALIQNTSDIIRILDSKGLIIFDSPAASRSLGYPPGYFIGKNPLDFIHPDDQDRVTKALAEVMDRKNPGTPTEYRIRTSDGSYVDVESTSMNLFGVQGVDGIVAITRIITERKRAERMLKESEKNYRDLYDNAPNAYYTIGTDGRIVQCNRQAGELLGIPPDRLIGEKTSSFYADTDSGKAKARQLFAAFRAGKEIVDEELQMRRDDGTIIWINLTVNAIRDDTGRITGSRTIITDITQRRALMDELQKKNENLAENRRVLDTLIHNLPGMMYRCRNDPEWTMEFVSDGCETLTGYPADALRGNHMVSYGALVYADDRESVWNSVQSGIDAKNPFQTIYRITNRQGELRWVWEKGRGVFDESGTLTAIEGYITDITGYEQAEEKFRESEEKFRLIVENSHDIIYKLTSDGVFLFVSPAWTSLLGHPLEDVVGHAFQEFVHPEDLSGCMEFMNSVTRQGRRQSGVEYRARHADGTWRWHTSSGVPFRDESGNIGGFYGMAHDITKHKQMEAALRTANKKLNLLSGITRHDIRNQLLALESYLEISRKSLGNPEKTTELIDTEKKITRNIASQISFTKDYEDLGVKTPVWQNVNNVIRSVTRRLPMRGIAIEMVDYGPEIFADPLLEKVFYNLIDNALKYGGEQLDTIRVSFRESEQHLIITVEDNGIGITAEDKQQLFTKGFGKNTGLGLFLSREILAITGITMTENGVPGKCARFEITVPNGGYWFISRQ